MSGSSVLLVGNYTPSLAIARSLTAAGYRIIAGDGGEFSTLRWSRACHEVWPHPPIGDPDAFLDALAEYIHSRPDIGHLIPVQSRYVALFAARPERLPRGPVIVTPDPRTVLTCLDKTALYQVADRVGVRVPAWTTVEHPAVLPERADLLGYPCIVRPRRDADGPMPDGRKAAIFGEPDALRSEIRRWPADLPPLFVQRFEPGMRLNVAFVAEAGVVRATLPEVATRTDRIDGAGFGVEAISVRRDDDLDRTMRVLIGGLGYTGVGSAQFMNLQAGGAALLELNPRLGLATNHVLQLGLDTPLAALRLAEGEPWHLPAGATYPVGARIVWTARDLYGWRMSIHRGELGPRAASAWLWKTFTAAVTARRHMTWDRRDPLPTLTAHAQLARVMLRPGS